MIYADLHIHVGRSLDGKAVKITAANSLNLPNIISMARDIKGLNYIGIIDAHSSGVQQDFQALIANGILKTLPGGGYKAGKLTVIPGIEVELSVGVGNAHFLAYFATIQHIAEYVRILKPYVKNWQLSSQKAFIPFEQWLEAVKSLDGIWLPAHAFTPHKGIYGNCCSRMLDVLPELPRALEIGLSADRAMAHCISELDRILLFSNSDAHSLPKIAREYNALDLYDESFVGLEDMILGQSGGVIANFGLPPQVGKYHRSYCLTCEKVISTCPPQLTCPDCDSKHIVTGVLDRLISIADRDIDKSTNQGYVYQVPLNQLPGIGPKMYKRLLDSFGTEMSILNEVPENDLMRIAGEKIALLIIKSRRGELNIEAGGGGVFGKIID